MKCRECPDYRECNKKHDLRRYRPHCSKAKEKKVFTNADRIRAMSDEELINLLSAPCPFLSRVDDKGCPNPKPCRECIAERLKQPAEEDA